MRRMAPSLPTRTAARHGRSKALCSFRRMKNGSSRGNAGDLPSLDETDRRIIAERSADGRVSFAEVGRRVSLSPPAVAARVQRRERAGVITGYGAELGPRRLGYQ